MNHAVGPKGQVVIKKEIRDRLGVKPGWRALQMLAGDHVEIYFVPAPHHRSLAGSLAEHVKRTFPSEAALREAREEAWGEAARGKVAASRM